MRDIKLHGLLALLVFLGTTGCKSMPSLTWWKTASKTEAPDATAIAHEAPALPSEIALQKENAAAVATSTASAAAPYVSTGAEAVNPAAYPATTAPAFDPTKAAPAQVATAATTPAASPNVGSIALPYNPNLVPPATQTNSAVAQAPAAVDRYGTMANTAPAAPPSNYSAPAAPATTVPANPAPTTPAATDSIPGLGSRYASAPVTTNPPQTTPSPAYTAPSASATASSATSSLGDRYANQSAAASNTPPTISQPVTSPPAEVPMYQPGQQNLASSQPYRPGGTSSYPGAAPAQPTYNVASRPEEPSDNTATGQEVPNVTTPEATADPTTQRYW